MVDYKILEDIPHYGQNRKDLERRYMCASLGLFYVQGSGHLLPIAIQLHQQPSDDLIWTPNDSELDWLCAKLWLRNSDAQFHQVSQWVLCRIRSHDPNSFCWMANDSEGQENKDISSIRKLISFFFSRSHCVVYHRLLNPRIFVVIVVNVASFVVGIIYWQDFYF